MKKLSLFLALLMIVSLTFAGCGSSNPPAQSPSGSDNASAPADKPADKPIRVAVCLAGMLGDLGYNDLLKEGADRATADFGVEVKMLEATGSADFEGLLASAIAGGYDLIICQGSGYLDMLAASCAEYPDQKFGITDAILNPTPDNLTCAAFAPNEGQFLVGACMALLTTRTDVPGINEAKKVGWITGNESPNLNDFWAGFEQGVHYIDPEIEILKAYAGSFSDPVKGKEIALAQYEQGADVIAQVASRTGLGIIEASDEAGLYCVGVDQNQDGLAPGHVICSMIKRIDEGVYKLIESVVKDEFQGGGYIYMDLKAGGIDLTDFSVWKEALGDKYPADIVEQVQGLRQKIIDGEIVVNTFPGIRPWE